MTETDDPEAIITAIREGLADVEAGRTQPARTALQRLVRKYGFTEPSKSETTSRATTEREEFSP
ncbi:hypothetical protein SH668x_002364 [Planctomicrobium sp. SH668]|uniref:hypothetical protein n=1 Tax=Planctomicrobium sp. SH668 TaxID=3448126 RepID=UPI003F5C25C6